MPKPSKSEKQAKQAIMKRWHPEPPTLDPLRLAFSVIVDGLEPEKTFQAMLWNDLRIESYAKVYEEMRKVCSEIICMANESMEKVRLSLPTPCLVSFDGSWEHRRNAMRCLFSVIYPKTGQVLNSIVVSNKVPRNDPTFCETPSLMESQGLKALLPDLMKLTQITGYIHDNDAKTRKIIRDAGWKIDEFLDVGHCQKSFERKIINFNRKNGGILKEIEDSLKKWLRVVVGHRGSLAEKRELWTNAAKHFCGDHSKCPPHRECETWSLAENPKSVELLEIFLRRTLFIVETCAEDNTTQANESLHRLKLKYASKDVKWGFTWEARMMCAVLDRNEVGWKLQLYNRLGLPPLSEENYERLMKLEQARIARKLWVHSDRYRGWQLEERKKRRRFLKRKIAKAQAVYEYKPNPYAK